LRIKICCIQTIQEARLSIRSNADALGLVSENLSGTHRIPDDAIRRIAESVPPEFPTVLLTSHTDPAHVVSQQKSVQTSSLQLVGPIEPEAVGRVREALPGVTLVKVVHVESVDSIDLASAYFEVADALLLDSKKRGPDGVALGGTGETHDWSISRQIVEASPIPVVLAGGLSAENVENAIRAVRPFGVDVCSSLRPHGALDPARLIDFVARAARATS
jgi:phosphoribosylanthranilate isomerase